MKLPFLSFRLKLFFVLAIIITFLVGFLYLSLRFETHRQIDRSVSAAATQAQKAFHDVETLWQDQLRKVSLRFTESSRIPGAFEAALDEEDPEVLLDAARYELRLAGLNDVLAVFAFPDGKPFTAMVRGEPVSWSDVLTPGETVNGEDLEVSIRYIVYAGELYAVSIVPLNFFGRMLGEVMLGFPVDREVSLQLGEVLNAQVAFVVNGTSVVATVPNSDTFLLSAMVAASKGDQRVIQILEGGSLAVISDPLPTPSGERAARVCALDLKETLAPFRKIQQALWIMGLAAMIMALIVATLLSRSLTSPIRNLVQATDRVALGDLDFEVTVTSRDELGLLARAFNSMVRGLSLKERYRSLLDKVVSAEVAEEMLKGEVFLGGETREITTLFADIRGFTSLTEGMEPQEVIAMLNEVMDRESASVEQEGGVVDKYVGDALMAVFGAPVAHEDDPLRAVKAALSMQNALSELNESRLQRDLPSIHVGIGVNTGEAVAGNMGSHRRLNYTVLGESVNLASRLCSAAGPGEILVSESTYRRIRKDIDAVEREAIKVKGFTRPVPVYSVLKSSPSSRASFNPTILSGMILALVFLFSSVQGIMAQNNPGIVYTSSSGNFQLDLKGRLSLEGYLPDDSPAWLVEDTEDAFVSGRISLYLSADWKGWLRFQTELRGDRSEYPSSEHISGRFQQAYFRLSHPAGRGFYFQAGKFVSPFGAYPRRHDSVADPLIRPPVMYDYRTMICPGFAPPDNNKFIDWKDRPEHFRPMGAPIIWAAPYQIGALVGFQTKRIDLKLGIMNGAPSAEPKEWNRIPWESYSPSYVVDILYTVSSPLKVGFSYSRGPYSTPAIESTLPYDATIDDYIQEIYGLNAAYAAGWTEVRAEIFWDRWEVPNVTTDPKDLSWMAEVKQKFMAGFFGAVRFGKIHFNDLKRSNGTPDPWDYDFERLQVGLGYNLTRTLLLKTEYMWNRTDGPYDPNDNLASVQLSWLF